MKASKAMKTTKGAKQAMKAMKATKGAKQAIEETPIATQTSHTQWIPAWQSGKLGGGWSICGLEIHWTNIKVRGEDSE